MRRLTRSEVNIGLAKTTYHDRPGKKGLKILIIGAGACGRAVSHLINRIYGLDTYYYDIDPSKDIDGSIRSDIIYGFDIYHICVPENSVASVVKEIPEDPEIVINSTMPPGSTRSLDRENIVYMPLFFREKHIEEDIETPGRIVLGTSDGSCPDGWAGSLASAWARRSSAKIYCVSYEEAEIVKLGTNALRALAISFYNEIYEILRIHGRDHRKVFEILSPSSILDELEGGMWGRKYNLAGKPFDGKCLPKDVAHLARSSPMANSLFKSILAFNSELAAKQIFNNRDRKVQLYIGEEGGK